MTSPIHDDKLTQGIGVPVRSMGRGESIRYGIALGLGAFLWVSALIGPTTILLPAKFGVIAPDQRVEFVGLSALLGAVCAVFANILFGALSDLTRSRWGARSPWLIAGSIVSAAALFGVATAESVGTTFVWWAVFQFAINAVVAPMIATLPDRTPRRMRGTYSAIYGVGILAGTTISVVIASRFLGDIFAGFMVSVAFMLISGIFFVVLAPDRSNRDQPREAFSPRSLLRSFSFPTKGARDFYLALIGKFLVVASGMMITNYQLYIFLDYVQLGQEDTANAIAALSVIALIMSLIFGILSGPFSDRVGKRKIFVVVSALLIAVGWLLPAFAPAMWLILIGGTIAAIGTAIFNSVDQALNTEVLPDPKTAAKDLGILNVAINAGQALGPAITSLVVTISGGYQLAFPVAAGLALLAAVTIKLIRSVP